jgi:hypothetical protein
MQIWKTPKSSLVPALRKAIRLAKLCESREYQMLFALQLDGASIDAGRSWFPLVRRTCLEFGVPERQSNFNLNFNIRSPEFETE